MSTNPGNDGAPKFGKMVPGGGGMNPNPGAPTPPGPAPASPYAPPSSPAPSVPAYSSTPAAPPATGVAATDPILFTLGDIAVSRSWVVTPNGTAPMRGSTWIGQDMSRTETKTPTWAIVLAIIGFLACLLGLLFLLVKEEQTRGYFEITVQSGSVRHVAQLPVRSAAEVVQYRQLVHQAQSLAAAA